MQANILASVESMLPLTTYGAIWAPFEGLLIVIEFTHGDHNGMGYLPCVIKGDTLVYIAPPSPCTIKNSNIK